MTTNYCSFHKDFEPSRAKNNGFVLDWINLQPEQGGWDGGGGGGVSTFGSSIAKYFSITDKI